MRAGTIQPLGYVRGLARAAIGAARRSIRKARSGWPSGGRGWRLATDRGSVRPTGSSSRPTLRRAPWPQPRREQIHLPYFNFATPPLSAELQAAILPGREGCWDTKSILSSFRRDRAGRLVFGSVGALRGTGLAIHEAWARRALRKLFPRIGKVVFEAQWYGMIGMTRDAVPRFHRLDDRVVAFCGYNGRGIGPELYSAARLPTMSSDDWRKRTCRCRSRRRVLLRCQVFARPITRRARRSRTQRARGCEGDALVSMSAAWAPAGNVYVSERIVNRMNDFRRT